MSKKSLVWLCTIGVLLIAGCRGGGKTELRDDTLTDPDLEERINDYLAEHIAIIGFGGKPYCAYEMLNADQGKGGNLYIWALCQEYTLDGGSLRDGSGISLPVALQIQQDNQPIEIMGHLVPRDGSYYGPDVRSIFPRSTWPQIMSANQEDIGLYNYRANELMKATRMKARLDAELESED
jgi:hypothetical protein